MAASISSIFVYPIKSCRGISLLQAPITATVWSGCEGYDGLNSYWFRWDRQCVVVNGKGRRACTQRVEPKLALVLVELPSEASIEDWEPTESSFMVLKAPGMNVLKVSLSKPHETLADGVSVWEWSGSALDEGDEASQWFSDFLGKPYRLVRFNTASETRPMDPKYAPGHKVLFSDMSPYMLLSQGSLDALNELLNNPNPINRFRPNILVDGCEPFAEDLWTEIKINNFTFQGVRLCTRCKIPTINQETGIASPEIGETLKSFRSDTILRPTQKRKGKVYFGLNIVWNDSLPVLDQGKGKVIEVGNLVYVLRKVSSANEAVG